MAKVADTKPRQVKNFGIAFFLLSLLMIAAQLINFIITLLPAAEETVIDVGDGVMLPVSALSDSYLTLVIIAVVVYGGIWFGVFHSMNWARWGAVALAVLAAIIAVQGIAQVVSAGFPDMVGLSLSLAQLLAAGWVLALAFRQEIHEWYTRKTPQ